MIAPAGAYLAAVHPAWTAAYVVDPDGLSGFVAFVGMVLPASALFAGYAGGWQIVRSRGPGALRAALAAGIGLLILIALVGRGRVFHVGTYAAFYRGDALPIVRTKLFYALIVLGAGLVAAAVLVGRALRGEARRKTTTTSRRP